MDMLLGMLEVPQQEKVIIDETKLRYFISKIWNYFPISKHAYENLPVEKKESMHNRYYNELYDKYYGTGNFVFFILLFLCLLFAIFCLISILLLIVIVLGIKAF